MRYGSLFTGVGMLDVGLHLAGLTDLRWVCEADDWRREEVLARRFPTAVRHADVRAVRADTAEPVDLIAGGFPCKGASTAGKRGGFDHPETVLWREMFRAVRELRPRYVLIENVSNLLTMARAPGEPAGTIWGEVLADLAALGFDVEWDCIPAGAVGAPHLRDRVFAVATHADGGRRQGSSEPSGRTEEGPRAGDCRGTAADANGPYTERVAGQRRQSNWRTDVGGGSAAPPHPSRDGVRQQPEPERGGGGAPVAGWAGAAAADSQGERGQGARGGRSALARATSGRGVPVEWGDYEPAIRRWEAIHGPAPEPLVRRVDARRADVSKVQARLERSRMRAQRQRLSALGDGNRCRAAKLRGTRCEQCGTTDGLHAHHRDEDPANNAPENIATLCGSCHLRWHWRHGKRSKR